VQRLPYMGTNTNITKSASEEVHVPFVDSNGEDSMDVHWCRVHQVMEKE
jgi:hypothetical protein